MIPALVLIIAYLLGSIPSGLIAGKAFFGIDIREHGSGNLGATNSFRVLGKKAGAFVTAADICCHWTYISRICRIPRRQSSRYICRCAACIQPAFFPALAYHLCGCSAYNKVCVCRICNGCCGCFYLRGHSHGLQSGFSVFSGCDRSGFFRYLPA